MIRKFLLKELGVLILLLTMGQNLLAQDITIKGNVTDEIGLPFVGVTVSAKGTTNGTITDDDGNFTLSNLSIESILVFSYIGMITEEVIVGEQTRINIKLESETLGMEEFIVVGYGTQKKGNLTGAVDMVTSEVLENRPISNVSEGLQGVIPNLNVTIFNGDPTRSADLNVRGFESINGGEPLVLVDGAPMDLDRINPNDIESISVLKDAAAGAIYGARAAFGVILIETKKGKAGVNVSFGSEFGFDKPIFHHNPVTNAYEYWTFWNKMMERDGRSGKSEEEMEKLRKYWEGETDEPFAVLSNNKGEKRFENYGNSDLSDELLNAYSPSQKYNMSVSGGSEKSRFYTSFGYYNENGFLNHEANSNFKRYNVLLKADFNVTDWLTLNQQISFNARNSDKPSINNLNNFMRVSPNRAHVVPYLEDFPEIEGMYWKHELMILPTYDLGGRAQWSDTDTWLKAGVTLKPFRRFSINGNINYQLYNRQNETHFHSFPVVETFLGKEPTITYYGNDEVQTQRIFNQYYVINTFAEYLLEDIPSHYFKAVVGFNQELGLYSSMSASATDFASEQIPVLGATTGEEVVGGSKDHVALRGAFYRVNYIYRDKYLIETNGRYDGTSRFSKNSRFGFFPSVSVGWRITEEPFMQGLRNYVDFAKIRASYGELGNQLLGNDYYTYIAPMTVNSDNFIFNTGPSTHVSMPDSKASTLTWESVATKNLGFDLAFLNQRLNATFDIYSRETKDMLMKRRYPTILGTDAPFENAADLRTKGWDLSLKWEDRPGNEFGYSIKLTLADWISEITRYDNPTGTLNELGSSNYYVGQRLGEIWGYETEGIIQDSIQLNGMPDQSFIQKDGWKIGDIQYKDLDDNDTINIGHDLLSDHGDKKIIGNSNPRYSFGIKAGVNYKNFSFSAFFQGIGKRDYYPSNENWTWFFPFRSYSFDQSWLEDSWTPENRDAYWPAAQLGDKNYKTQTRYLQDVSYIRLKNITLSYDLPNTISKKLLLKQVKLYVSAQNLWEYSKVRKPLDPEYIYNKTIDYPLMRSYAFGIIVNL